MKPLQRIISFLIVFGFILLAGVREANAKLKVVASTTDVAALVRAIGADDVILDTIARGTQDPHYIETKPSYMVKMAGADLLVANGLALETGWLPSLIQGARNQKIKPGSEGYLELGTFIEPLEIPQGEVTRAMGDVHPEGNPHFTLDPERMAKLGNVLAERLGKLDASKKEAYAARAKAFEATTNEKMKSWKVRASKLPQKKVVAYHKSLSYFLARFGLQPITYVEPKPGIPPAASHILEVVDLMKREGAKAILVDNFFEPKIAERIAKDVPGAKVELVGIAVESKPELKTLSDVTDQLLTALERAMKP